LSNDLGPDEAPQQAATAASTPLYYPRCILRSESPRERALYPRPPEGAPDLAEAAPDRSARWSGRRCSRLSSPPH
jgi:hypothetical protein